MLLKMTKDHVAEILNEIATLLELKGENPFKSRAYVNAARAIETCTEPLEKVFAEDSTTRLKGVGESLQEKIRELLTTGKLGYYEELKDSTPPGLVAMLAIPGLGPKKIKALHDKHACPVVYLTGTVGGLMTSLHVEIKSGDGKELDDGTSEKTERYGELLASVADRALKAARPVKLTPLPK